MLYNLYTALREAGYESFIYCLEQQDSPYQHIYRLDKKTRENDIVVYPEVVSGNPLRFRHVARYVLYYPGRIGGEKEFFPAEKIFTWHKMYIDAPELRFPYIDSSIFFDAGLPKTQDCYFINKRGKWRDAPEIAGLTEINMGFPESREDLGRLLQTTGILYSFDATSSLNLEACLCGAKVKIIREHDIVDYQRDVPDDLPVFQQQLAEFIRQTQAMRYEGPLEPYPLHKDKSMNSIELAFADNALKGFIDSDDPVADGHIMGGWIASMRPLVQIDLVCNEARFPAKLQPARMDVVAAVEDSFPCIYTFSCFYNYAVPLFKEEALSATLSILTTDGEILMSAPIPTRV